ncbi:hypothetical protein EV2_010996 [Malus domestica]
MGLLESTPFNSACDCSIPHCRFFGLETWLPQPVRSLALVPTSEEDDHGLPAAEPPDESGRARQPNAVFYLVFQAHQTPWQLLFSLLFRISKQKI